MKERNSWVFGWPPQTGIPPEDVQAAINSLRLALHGEQYEKLRIIEERLGTAYHHLDMVSEKAAKALLAGFHDSADHRDLIADALTAATDAPKLARI